MRFSTAFLELYFQCTMPFLVSAGLMLALTMEAIRRDMAAGEEDTELSCQLSGVTLALYAVSSLCAVALFLQEVLL